MATINALYQCAELADIKKWLSDADLSTKIDDLLAEFNRLKDYKNAVEWNHLETMCEAITMLDTWEKFNLEPLEAFCQKGLSGSWETVLYNANWNKHAGSWRDWSKSGDSFVIYKGADCNNYGVTKLNSQRNMLPTNPFKIGRFLGNCQQSVKSFVAEVRQLNTNFEAHMQPKHYGDGFYYAKINTNFSRHDWPGHPSVQSQYFHAQSDMPADCKNGYVEPHMSFGKLSTRRNRLCWAVDLYYTRAWGELR